MNLRTHISNLLVPLLLAAPLAAITGCRNEARSEEAIPAPASSNVREAVFQVDGMTCASCNVTVKVAAERVAGVRTARADADEGRAWVTFDPAVTTPAQIASAISQTGYQATPLDDPKAAAAESGEARADAVPPDVACRVLREGVYRLWPELGRAPRPREIARALGMPEPDVNRALDALSAHEFPCGQIERAKHSDRIVFAWPLSNVPTEYVVEIEGMKPVYGRCAIDSLGVSAMYGKRVEIEATSIASGAPIRITVNGTRVERAEPADAVVWVAGEECGCDDMILAVSRAELAEWRQALGKPEGHTLSLEEATAYGVKVFGARLHTN
jgi:copper chaperone CopZ